MALFIVLGGSAYAAKKVGTRKIKDAAANTAHSATSAGNSDISIPTGGGDLIAYASIELDNNGVGQAGAPCELRSDNVCRSARRFTGPEPQTASHA